MSKLRSSRSLQQKCPLCRSALTPLGEDVYLEGLSMYKAIKKSLRITHEGSWQDLNPVQKRKMEEVRRKWAEAAEKMRNCHAARALASLHEVGGCNIILHRDVLVGRQQRRAGCSAPRATAEACCWGAVRAAANGRGGPSQKKHHHR